MAELSLLWTTDAATPEGDQQASYTQAQLAILHKIIAACSGYQGVAPGFLNELACTGAGANTVAVATGGAMVDGIAYLNDASQNVNIPSAVGGGNTRIDRIVLRADWAGFNVSVHRIAGTDAGSPTAPAITQTPGTTYDIQLCQVLVNTAGAVTVTDERVWAAGNANSLLAGAVTAGKIATGGVSATAQLANDIVDDTKVGNRVPQFYRRQGGSATVWSTQGTTDYTPTTVRMQGGARVVASTATVTFPVAFSQAPLVLATSVQARTFAAVTAVSATQCTLSLWKDDGTQVTDVVYWLAIGPE